MDFERVNFYVNLHSNDELVILLNMIGQRPSEAKDSLLKTDGIEIFSNIRINLRFDELLTSGIRADNCE